MKFMKKWYWEMGNENTSWLCYECSGGMNAVSKADVIELDRHTDQDIPCSGCWDDPKQLLSAQIQEYREQVYSSDLGKAIEITHQLLLARTTEHEKAALKAVLAAASKQLLLELQQH